MITNEREKKSEVWHFVLLDCRYWNWHALEIRALELLWVQKNWRWEKKGWKVEITKKKGGCSHKTSHYLWKNWIPSWMSWVFHNSFTSFFKNYSWQKRFLQRVPRLETRCRVEFLELASFKQIWIVNYGDRAQKWHLCWTFSFIENLQELKKIQSIFRISINPTFTFCSIPCSII